MNGKHSWQTSARWRGFPKAPSTGMGVPHLCQLLGPVRFLAGSSPVLRLGEGIYPSFQRFPFLIIRGTWGSSWVDLGLHSDSFCFFPEPPRLNIAFAHSFTSFIQLFDKYFLSTRHCLGTLGTLAENKQWWFPFSR